MRQILFITAILFYISAFAQVDRTEQKELIFWQPKTSIQFSDFRKTIDSVDMKMFEKYKAKSLANLQMYAILDYPKNVRKIKTLKKKWYLAPVFCKECSALKEQDSVELKRTQLYFDIMEYCTRVTRKQITNMESQEAAKNSQGFMAAAFPGLVDKMYDLMIEMFGSYKREVITEKQPNAHNEWRKTVNQLLESTKDFSTSENEYQRFRNNKPLSDDYKVSYELYGK